uniref:Uncharacterized protein n=1 Tax=viral metagenome TaxID=1070528 RepID=A0A6C0EYB2_9ZZZZ
MSFNKLSYDFCAYKNELAQSTGSLGWVLDENRFYNSNSARINFGIVGGNEVSIIKGSMVDLESDLKGQTRLQSKCPQLQYLNQCSSSGNMTNCQPQQIVIKGNPSNMGRVIDTTPMHLKSAQMFRYTPIPLPQGIQMPRCR